MKRVAIVGASLAGISAARALRVQGFEGEVVVIGAEHHMPYDRPPLSKDFLLDKTTVDELALAGPEGEDLDLAWRLGVRAIGINRSAQTVIMESGEEVRVDGVVLATGAVARPFPGDQTRRLAGIHTLRTLDDAIALRDAFRVSDQLVVIGGGFIGAEVASSARALGLEVTIVEAGPVPLSGPLGRQMAGICTELHADHGVRVHAGTTVTEMVGNERVEGVRLVDGRVLPTDLVVVGIGATPAVDWLRGTGIDLAEGALGGVVTDARCATNVPGVVAVGDCAAVHSVHRGKNVRVEHWTAAFEQPATAVATLLSGRQSSQVYDAVPYFWSDQYDARIQFAGYRQDSDAVRIVAGDPAERRFVAVYERDGRPAAVIGMSQPREFTRWRRQVARRYSDDLAHHDAASSLVAGAEHPDTPQP